MSSFVPEKVTDIVNQTDALTKLRNWLSDPGRRKKVALVWGPSGIGKTCSVKTLAAELGYQTVEISSDGLADKEALSSIVSNAVTSRSLFGEKKLILVAEICGKPSQAVPRNRI